VEVETAAGVGLEDADAPAVDIVGAELFVDERSIWIRYQR